MTESTDISTKVLSIYRFIAFTAGIGNTFFMDWQTRQLSDLPNAIELFLPGRTKIVSQSWGITILLFALLANKSLSFSPGERRVVCRSFALAFGTASALFWIEPLAPWAEQYSSVPLGFSIFFACLCGAMTWASLEEIPHNENAPASHTTATTPAKIFLSKVFYVQAFVSLIVGLLAVFLPSAFSAFESSPENQQPPEAFAIRCWGGFSFAVGALCIQHKALAADSQVVVGLSLMVHFLGLTCLYLYEWDQLSYSYKIISIPVFIPLTIMWMIAISRVVTETSTSPHKQK